MAILTKQPALLIIPQLSEKGSKLAALNKYVFKVETSANKIEIRKALEKQFGVKIAGINILSRPGKVRRYGRFSGKTKDFKKAIVTLTTDSKKFDNIEA